MEFHNLQRMVFASHHPFGIPPHRTYAATGLHPAAGVDSLQLCERRKNAARKGLHFFVDDRQFERYWNRPTVYLQQLQGFACVLSPDFSLYRNAPVAVQIYNQYRKQWLTAYWQQNGIRVVPTISWAGEESFDWCFCGIPQNNVVAIGTVGCLKRQESRRFFEQGFAEMRKRLCPKQILCYGAIPEGYSDLLTPIGYFWNGKEA